jgi:DNA-binding CsgD family transcriptional regulator
VTSVPPTGQDILSEVSDTLAQTPTQVEAILAAATSALSRSRGSTWVASLMNPDPDTSRIVVAADRDPAIKDWIDRYLAAIDSPEPAPTAESFRQVIESGEPIVGRIPYQEWVGYLSPAGQAFVRRNPAPGDVQIVGTMIVPMRVGGATIGTLAMLDFRNGSAIVEADLHDMQLVAERLALSLEHARLVQTRRDSTMRLEITRAIALANRHSRELPLTLRIIAEQLISLPEVDAVDVLLLTDDGRELHVAASAGYRWPWPPEDRVQSGWARLDRTVLAPTVDYIGTLDLKGHNPRRSRFAREGFQTFVSVPLYTARRPFGVLEMYSRSIVQFEQEGLDFFDTLGGLIALAIESGATAVAAPATGVPRPTLSYLELQILSLVADGYTNREIAGQVHRSENTVKFHVRRILEKAGAPNRTELARRATREGWL